MTTRDAASTVAAASPASRSAWKPAQAQAAEAHTAAAKGEAREASEEKGASRRLRSRPTAQLRDMLSFRPRRRTWTWATVAVAGAGFVEAASAAAEVQASGGKSSGSSFSSSSLWGSSSSNLGSLKNKLLAPAGKHSLLSSLSSLSSTSSSEEESSSYESVARKGWMVAREVLHRKWIRLREVDWRRIGVEGGEGGLERLMSVGREELQVLLIAAIGE